MSTAMPSTVIRKYVYDATTGDLWITFVSGRRYIYAEVPPDIFTAFNEAPSRGTFFNHAIRDRYDYREVMPSGADRDR
jgi:hypothetical protein